MRIVPAIKTSWVGRKREKERLKEKGPQRLQ
jgi:hypothetical protein